MSRHAILLLGVLAYLSFLATFLYLVGFVGDLGVPRSVARGPASPLSVALAVDVALVALFAAQHSVMARRGFKRRWTRLVPPAAERALFVLATSLVLCALFALWRPLPTTIWRVDEPVGRIALATLFWTGWGLVLVSTFLVDHLELFGLRQVWAHFRGRPLPRHSLQVRSLYRAVRHPINLGFLLALWSTAHMTAGRLLLAALVTAYVLIAIRLEEQDLLVEHGPRYARYRREVPMLLPRPRATRIRG